MVRQDIAEIVSHRAANLPGEIDAALIQRYRRVIVGDVATVTPTLTALVGDQSPRTLANEEYELCSEGPFIAPWKQPNHILEDY